MEGKKRIRNFLPVKQWPLTVIPTKFKPNALWRSNLLDKSTLNLYDVGENLSPSKTEQLMMQRQLIRMFNF